MTVLPNHCILIGSHQNYFSLIGPHQNLPRNDTSMLRNILLENRTCPLSCDMLRDIKNLDSLVTHIAACNMVWVVAASKSRYYYNIRTRETTPSAPCRHKCLFFSTNKGSQGPNCPANQCITYQALIAFKNIGDRHKICTLNQRQTPKNKPKSSYAPNHYCLRQKLNVVSLWSFAKI